MSVVYAAVMRRRRERYAARPDLRRRLRHPVISVGNLAVGGRGKTPMVATIARLLLEMGERPAILSRGYARRIAVDGVVVVRDASGIRADLDRGGDEPLMLARQLPGVAVLTAPDRYLAGRLAEHRLDVTVHVVDDGFQHLQLERDVDIVLVSSEDVRRPRTLPSGRLREPLDTLIVADAILAVDREVRVDTGAADIPVFRTTRRLGEPDAIGRDAPVFAVAAVASPARFFDDLRAAGWQVCGTAAFRDHLRYSARGAAGIFERARGEGAAAVLTTEKDLVRLLPFRPFPMRLGAVPLTMEPDPLPEFRQWLAASMNAARDLIA